MNQVNCPYIKISEDEAAKISFNQTFGDFSLVSTANAQSAQSQIPDPILNTAKTVNEQLSTPFYITILLFFLFVILMSVVYLYHWFKFSLNDPFIKNFIPIYFAGLIILTIPLIFNIFF